MLLSVSAGLKQDTKIVGVGKPGMNDEEFDGSDVQDVQSISVCEQYIASSSGLLRQRCFIYYKATGFGYHDGASHSRAHLKMSSIVTKPS